MNDQAWLAAVARRSLTDAASATLLVAGLGRVDSAAEAVLLCERNGLPVLVCDAGSRLATAAADHSEAVLTVPTEPELPGSATFGGRLAATGTETGIDGRTSVIELQLEWVVVERDDPASALVGQHRIPLHHFGLLEPSLTRAAEQLRKHANTCHAERLRAFAARRAAVPVSSVAAAELARIDSGGADLDWIDEHGAHRLQLRFPQPAADHRQLATALRDEIGAAR